MWKFQLNHRNYCILGVGILANFFFFMLAHRGGSPLWLDTVGTAYTALLIGPLAGMLVGMVNNAILSLCFNSPWSYYLVSAGIALVVGYAARKGKFRDFFSCIGVLTVVYLLTVILCVGITMMIFGGMDNSNSMTGEVYTMLKEGGINTWVSCCAAYVLTKLPDVIIGSILVWIMFILTPRGFKREMLEESISPLSPAKTIIKR